VQELKDQLEMDTLEYLYDTQEHDSKQEPLMRSHKSNRRSETRTKHTYLSSHPHSIDDDAPPPDCHDRGCTEIPTSLHGPTPPTYNPTDWELDHFLRRQDDYGEENIDFSVIQSADFWHPFLYQVPNSMVRGSFERRVKSYTNTS